MKSYEHCNTRDTDATDGFSGENARAARLTRDGSGRVGTQGGVSPVSRAVAEREVKSHGGEYDGAECADGDPHDGTSWMAVPGGHTGRGPGGVGLINQPVGDAAQN